MKPSEKILVPIDVSADSGPIFDMAVMGTYGRGGLNQALLGSVAEKVVRRVRCPVMTVRARD
jgi:nucleotide-binding universal stress UspA family protein